ncbi:MAG: hypothetical protein WB420_10395 [Bradyrhizobium sp.]
MSLRFVLRALGHDDDCRKGGEYGLLEGLLTGSQPAKISKKELI